MLKEFTVKLRYMRRNIVGHKYTVHFETVRMGLVPWEENLVHRIVIVRSVQFNSFIDCEWINNGLAEHSPSG